MLTKLDGTAKGGIALAIARELNIPVKLIGIGEQLEDLRPFDADDFARALLAAFEPPAAISSRIQMDAWVIWILVAVAFGVGEMLTTSFVLAPFSGGALVAALSSPRSEAARSSPGASSSSSRC